MHSFEFWQRNYLFSFLVCFILQFDQCPGSTFERTEIICGAIHSGCSFVPWEGEGEGVGLELPIRYADIHHPKKCKKKASVLRIELRAQH